MALAQQLRPVVRLIRKKLVLAIIFCLSFTYCIVSLLRDNDRPGILPRYHHIDTDHDYNDIEETDRFRFGGMRRGGQLPWSDEGAPSGSAPDTGQNGLNRIAGASSNHLADILNANETSVPLAEPKHSAESESKNCRNSVQGKVLISDDRGYVCYRKELIKTGCCNVDAPSTRRHTCETCTNGCCAIFEYCVSCCLEPSNKPLLSKLINEKSNGGFPHSILYTSLTDHFDFCLARCRTSSQSVQHENSYRDPKNKHCFLGVDDPEQHAAEKDPDQAAAADPPKAN